MGLWVVKELDRTRFDRSNVLVRQRILNQMLLLNQVVLVFSLLVQQWVRVTVLSRVVLLEFDPCAEFRTQEVLRTDPS